MKKLLLLAALLAGAAPIHADLLVKDGQKVAFMGDSITAQGTAQPGGYVSLVIAGLAAEGVKIVPIPVGVSGNTSKDMLGRLDRDVLAKQPDWMTLSCGVNDVWHGGAGVDLETYKKNMASILDQAQAKGIKVVVLTATVIYEDLSTPNNQKLADYNDFLRQTAKERKLPLADLNAAFQEALGAKKEAPAGALFLTNDGVHPNPEGHRLMARGILKAFGVPDGDFQKIEAAWNAIPAGAAVMGRVAFQGADPLTFADYDLLKKVAAARGTTVSALCNTLYLQIFRQVLEAHAQDAVPQVTAIQTEAEQRFQSQIAVLIKPGS